MGSACSKARALRRPPLPPACPPAASERPFWNVNWKHRLQPLAPAPPPFYKLWGSSLGLGAPEN